METFLRIHGLETRQHLPGCDHRSVSTASNDIPATTSALGRIRAMLPSLPPSDLRAAQVIANRGADILSCSITQVAQEAGVAESTVIRACKRLGFSGFQDIKLAIAKDTQSPTRFLADEIDDNDAAPQIIEKIFGASAAVIADAATSVDPDRLNAVVAAVAKAGQVLFVGFGPSSPIAQDAAYRFRSLGVRVDAPLDPLTQHLAAAMLRERDVCIAVSHTGATRETLDVVQAANDRGATTAAITSFARSPLTELAHHALIAGGRQLGFRVEAMASRLAHICVIDALYVTLAMRDQAAAREALEAHHRVSTHHQL
jgi:RpiR family transcriptional regulator, carbohydrate utilization regulator